MKNEEIVVTGQYLGVIEEFLPDKQCTFIKDGNIYASISGMVKLNEQKRELEIETHQEKDRKTVKIGDIVIGTIIFLRKYSVGLNFYTINRKVHFNSGYLGNIHVSNISNRFVRDLKEAFQITDIVRAKVIDHNLNEYYLTTSSKHLGVIHADCMQCGTPLEKIGFNKLKCPFCGHIEQRKLADDYGKISINLIY
ncbi:MAG: exosome complex RNA-binding protein Csl4 [Promethearchaeota archaeon]